MKQMILRNINLFIDEELNSIASTADKCGNLKKLKELADYSVVGDLKYTDFLDAINYILPNGQSNITTVTMIKPITGSRGVIVNMMLFIGTPDEVKTRIESEKLSLDVVEQKVTKTLSHKSAVNVVVRFLTAFYEYVLDDCKGSTDPHLIRKANSLDDIERFNELNSRGYLGCDKRYNKYSNDKLKDIRSRPEEFTEEVLKEAFLAMDVYLVNRE